MMFDDDRLERQLKSELEMPLKLAIASELVSIGALTPGESARLSEFEAPPRRASWLKGRVALKNLLASLGQSSDTSNIHFPNPRFSLTHSGEYAVAIGALTSTLHGIGIDLEFYRNLHHDAARFFLNPQEQEWLMRLEESVRSRELLRLWTIKEAVYKSYPGNRGATLADFVLEHPEKQSGTALLPGAASSEIHYCSLLLTQGVLSAAIFPKRSDQDAG
jgi:phosphopantetheinyl transferase